MKLFSLRDKISAFFVVVIVALVVTSFYVVSQRVESSLRETLRDQLKESNLVFRQLQQFTLKQIQGKSGLAARQNRLLSSLSTFRELPVDEKARNIQAVVSHVARDLNVKFFLVYDANGQLLFPQELRDKPELARLPAVTEALSRQKGREQVIEYQGSLYLAAATPILYKDDGLDTIERLGAVLVAEELGPLARDVQQVAGGQAEVAITSGGHLLESTLGGAARENFTGLLASRKELFDKIESGSRRQTLMTFAFHGERQVALVIPIYERLEEGAQASGCRVSGSLTLIRSLDRVLAAQMRPIRRRLLMTGVIAILLTVMINFAFARSLTRPLSRLTEGLGEVARGNLRVEVPVTSRDEIGLLTSSFNEMVVGLSHKEKLTRMVSAAAIQQVEDSAHETLQLGGVKQVVTVLFSDVRNFTPMTERLGAREIVDLLNRYFAVAGEVITAHGGDIDKFIGDAIMVVFRSDEQSGGAARAVACAMELQRQVGLFNEQAAGQGRPEIAIGVGIATGEVVAGNVGTPHRLEYTVLGDTVNVAARLEGESKAGKHLQIMLDAETYAQVQQTVEVAVLEDTQLKGKSGPMTVYEVKGPVGL